MSDLEACYDRQLRILDRIVEEALGVDCRSIKVA